MKPKMMTVELQADLEGDPVVYTVEFLHGDGEPGGAVFANWGDAEDHAEFLKRQGVEVLSYGETRLNLGHLRTSEDAEAA